MAAEEGPAAPAIAVTLLYAPGPRQWLEFQLNLPAGASARQALLASGVLAQAPEIELAARPGRAGDGRHALSIWGRRAAPDTVLREGDRLEITRALQVDPKVARRERFRRQGARASGLFARRRPGAKPGY